MTLLITDFFPTFSAPMNTIFTSSGLFSSLSQEPLLRYFTRYLEGQRRIQLKLSLCVRKQTIWVSDQVRHKPGCTVTEEGKKLEILGFKKRNCTICVAKTKALISFAVTAKLICAFVFANADCWFAHAAAQFT